VTIAAGIRCDDGVLLCADSEHSNDLGKFYRTKIFNGCDGDLLVTGASENADYIKVGFDKMVERLRSAPANEMSARGTVEEVILNLHEEHIRPSANPSFQVDLIMALRCANAKLALVQTVGSTAKLIDHYSAVGTGWPLFEYWGLHLLSRAKLTMEFASHLAMFMLKEVKIAGYGCGGFTSLSKMPLDKQKLSAGRTVFNDDRVLADFPSSALDAIFTAFGTASDKELDEQLQNFRYKILSLSDQIKSNGTVGTMTANRLVRQ